MTATKDSPPKPLNMNYCLSTAVSQAVLLVSCIYGKQSFWSLFLEKFTTGVWSMFLANWKNFNKLFLHGYIWFGFCGASALIGVFRFGKNIDEY
jgi:hypothetical protein